MSKPLIAIVGRPNVGKSMLFNKIIGRRLSIVEDTPGVTRDRIYGESDWNGRKFTLVDTGGIEPNTDNEILAFMRQQAQIAIDNATVIVLVTDIKTGMTAADQEVAGMLQRSKKPIVLAVNKMDSTGPADPEFYEFYNLGLGDPIAVSAVHGHGTGDLLDACLQYFPPETDEEEDSDVIQVAIIGKPNVGKSSLTNKILGEERVIVHKLAAGKVQNAHSGLHFRKRLGVQVMERLRRGVDVHGEIVARAEENVEIRDVLDLARKVPRGIDREIRIIPAHLHIELERGIRPARADRAETDDADADQRDRADDGDARRIGETAEDRLRGGDDGAAVAADRGRAAVGEENAAAAADRPAGGRKRLGRNEALSTVGYAHKRFGRCAGNIDIVAARGIYGISVKILLFGKIQ